MTNDVASPLTYTASTQITQTGGEKCQRKEDGGKAAPSISLPPVTVANPKEHVEALRLERKQEVARIEREKAARLAREQEEAVRKEQEEAIRLAKEYAASIARRERQSIKEREEAKEKERTAQRRKQEQQWAKEAAVTIQQVILNSIVKFGAGLAIQHITCGFEASELLIKNLPMNAREPEVIGLFTQQGVDEQEIAVLEMESVDGRQQATVLGKAEDMEAVALDLDGMELGGESLSVVIRERPAEGYTMVSSSRNSYCLSISWPVPSLTMVARYPRLGEWRVSQRARGLDGRVLNGQRIKARYERGYNLDDWIVKISGIPPGTTVAEIRTFTGTQNVEAHIDDSTYTSDDVFNELTAHLCSLPNSTLHTFSLKNSSQSNSASAEAVFDSWEGAKSAHDSLEGKVLKHNFPPLRLSLLDPYYFTLTLDEKQYNAQKSQWTELCSGEDKEATAKTRIVDQAGLPKVIISLSGHNKKAVGTLKVRVESMAAGQRLDSTYWHPMLRSAGGQEFFNYLYETTGVYARIDRRHDCVSVSGGIEAIEAAKSLLLEEVECLSAEQWTIPLQRQALGFFIRGGLAKLKGLLGEKNVALDVESCRIVLHGADPEEAEHHLEQLIDAYTERKVAQPAASDDTLCPICYNVASQPIEISCEHIYCSSCLRRYILSNFDSHDFPLKCIGDDFTCNEPLSIPLIKKFLPPQRFEQLMKAALTSYIDENPGTFKYCNTPYCSQVYRVTTLPHEFECPSCFSEFCTACHGEIHPGVTCAGKQAQKNSGEQERPSEACAADHGVDSCHKCGEKIKGPKTMACGCRIYFCRACTEAFEADVPASEAQGEHQTNPEPKANQEHHSQPRSQVPDAVQTVSRVTATEEQSTWPISDRGRRNHAPLSPFYSSPSTVPAVSAHHRAFDTSVPSIATDSRIGQAESERQEQLQEIRRQQEAEEAEWQLREKEREFIWGMRFRVMEEARRQEQIRVERLVEEAIKRDKEEARRREAEESKRWCLIM